MVEINGRQYETYFKIGLEFDIFASFKFNIHDKDQRYSWGRPLTFFRVLCPPTIYALLSFYSEVFDNLRNIWSLISDNFFRKIPKNFPRNSEMFSTFSKSKETIVSVPKLVQNHCIDQNLAIIAITAPKTSVFS